MPRVIHFEINADDPERAAAFYGKVFGWQVKKWEGPVDYWLVTTGERVEPGIDGGIVRRMEPQAGTYNTVDVPSVEEFEEKVKKAGGTIVMGKRPVPGVGWMAYCTDTEGNVFGMMEEDPRAK